MGLALTGEMDNFRPGRKGRSLDGSRLNDMMLINNQWNGKIDSKDTVI